MSAPVVAKRRGGFSSRSLAKAIFSAEMPEQFIRTVPPQSLFMAVKQNGLVASSDLIEIATIEQCRAMLDFDCWVGDRFSEENFWEWLSLTDEDNGLALLQKLVRFVDLKLIALLISRYVEVQVFDEPTDNPPGPGFHTPDKGFTWLGIHAPDTDKHFLLARLLALVFETNAELFYQLISIPNVSTSALLEEESYQERTKRLAAEGVPERGWAFSIHSPLRLEEFTALLGRTKPPPLADIQIIEPIVYDPSMLEPLDSLLEDCRDREQAEMEFTLIANAGIVHWGVDFGDAEAVRALLERIKGTTNIGLERALEARSDLSAVALYEAVGLQAIYRLGLGVLVDLQILARKNPSGEGTGRIDASYRTVLRESALERYPQAPTFLDPRGEIVSSPSGEVPTMRRAFEHLAEVEAVRRFLS